MKILLLNLNFLLMFILCYKKIRHGLHIFQLENYYLGRYCKWIKLNLKKTLNVIEIALLAILIGVGFIKIELALTINALILIIMSLSFKREKEKKAFVVTNRIKRTYITGLILFFVIAFLGNSLEFKYSLILNNALIILGYFEVLLLSVINLPIEILGRRKYIRRAKKKLKKQNELVVVGITGSYGKTSSKYFLENILSKKYHVLMTPESYNTTMGVVRTINENLKSTHNLFICEMGAKYPKDIKKICDIVKPKYGILTAIGPQHLDTFKNIETVAKTKMELVDALPEDGIAFMNYEDENVKKQKTTKTIVKFGFGKRTNYYAENIVLSEKGSSFDIIMPKNRKISVTTKLLGKLNILNIVGAVSVADKLGLTEEEIKDGIKSIKPVEHRLELKQNPNGSIIIDDAYNSNINGAKNALDVLGSFENKNKILITPGIVELGDKQQEINEDLGKYAAGKCDFVILVGEKQAEDLEKGLNKAKYSKEKIYVAQNLEDAIDKMNKLMTKDTVVLLENDLPDNYL